MVPYTFASVRKWAHAVSWTKIRSSIMLGNLNGAEASSSFMQEALMPEVLTKQNML